MDTMRNNKRIVWLDVLRVLSALAIVFLHTSSTFLEKILTYGSFSWFTTDFYLAFTRFAVPVFVMISGVFFLNPKKEISIGNIYGKYILRMLTVLLTWALIRTLVIDVWIGSLEWSKVGGAFFTSIKIYWFLPMIIGLYMITPVLRTMSIVNNRSILKYFMTITVIIALCIPVMEAAEVKLFPGLIPLSDFMNLIKLPCLLFGAHFIFGYYAYNYDLSKRAKAFFYIAGMASILLMMCGAYVSWGDKASKLFFYSMHGASLSPLTFVLGGAIFIFCKDIIGRINFSDKAALYIRKLAYYSLGEYMVHIIIVEVLAHFDIFSKLNYIPVVMIPVTALVIFSVSNIIICGLYQLSWFRKYCL